MEVKEKIIDCFLMCDDVEKVKPTCDELRADPLVRSIVIVSRGEVADLSVADAVFEHSDLTETSTLQHVLDHAQAPFVLLYTACDTLRLGYKALLRMITVAHDTQAGWLYADHYQIRNGIRTKAPVIDYQKGSLRDDFDFGSVIMLRTDALRNALVITNQLYGPLVGLYDLRLKISREYPIVHIPEYLYTDVAQDLRTSGERIYDYCDHSNDLVQQAFEKVCTDHLKAIGAYLEPDDYDDVDLNVDGFPVEATVVIPVLNRERVIRDAIKSVLMQETDFDFNLIVVDNHSTDGTTEAIDEFSTDPRLIHIIPDRDDLGIGSCWNLAINDPRCGKFAIGLDSDDMYATPHTLQTMISQFYKDNAAMVCGTYAVTDFNLNVIPPGVIDHHEWTADNGRNNALHVNGIGGPRAFFVPVYRLMNLPPTNYGEDYAMGLMISRNYRLGRVWDVMTCARRW
ncbi:MAG: glycosyltransferase family 2 protein, partial [Muribaculaceae bacterium]|nr:glycosyltransferase family 2 protein [Muribaculaceae bacterium]